MRQENDTFVIPGFGTQSVLDYDSIIDHAQKTGYSVSTILTYDELRDRMSNEFLTNPDLTNIANRVNAIKERRKKTEDDYKDIYSSYVGAIKNIIQQKGYGVYEKRSKDQTSQMVPLDILARTLTSSFVGFDCLEDAVNDPNVTDIYCIAYNFIVVERSGHNEQYPYTFRSDLDYRNFVSRLLKEDNKQLDQGAHKIVDAEAYGIRINAIHQTVSSKGVTLTLRKHADIPITLENMVADNMLTPLMAEFCKLAVRGALNACVAGVTGSGKTTFLKALFEGALGNGDPDYTVDENMNRVLTVEDTPELFLRVPHTVALHTVPTGDKSTSIDLRDLNISALRMKPHYIVVGEIRGVEAASYIEAAATGHSSWTSIHAGTVWSGIDRFVDKYGMVMPNLSNEAAERIIGSSVNLFIMVDNIPGVGHRITAIHELVFDHDTNRVKVLDIVRYEYEKGFVWHNFPSNESIDMMMRRGIKSSTINEMRNKISNEINRANEEKGEATC